MDGETQDVGRIHESQRRRTASPARDFSRAASGLAAGAGAPAAGHGAPSGTSRGKSRRSQSSSRQRNSSVAAADAEPGGTGPTTQSKAAALRNRAENPDRAGPENSVGGGQLGHRPGPGGPAADAGGARILEEGHGRQGHGNAP